MICVVSYCGVIQHKIRHEEFEKNNVQTWSYPGASQTAVVGLRLLNLWREKNRVSMKISKRFFLILCGCNGFVRVFWEALFQKLCFRTCTMYMELRGSIRLVLFCVIINQLIRLGHMFHACMIISRPTFMSTFRVTNTQTDVPYQIVCHTRATDTPMN